MTGMRFEPGELVNVQIRGVRFVRHEPDGALTVQTNDPDEHLWALPPQAAIERVAPKEWPPQPGDAWEDHNGREWLGVKSLTGSVKLVAADGYDEQLWPRHALEQSGWRLVRRRDRAPDEDGRTAEKASGS